VIGRAAALMAVLLAVTQALLAQQLRLQPDGERTSMLRNALILEDADGTMTFRDVRAEPLEDGWVPVHTDAIPAGYSKASIWARIQLDVPPSAADSYYVELPSAQLNSAALYLISPNGSRTVQRAGAAVRAGDRSIVDLYPVFHVDLNAPGGYDLYLNLRSDTYLGTPVYLSSRTSYMQRRWVRETAVYMLLGGFVFAIGFAAARLAARGEPLFAGILAYLILMFVGIWTGFGDAARLIVPNRPAVTEELFRPSLFLASAFILQITFRTLPVERLRRRLQASVHAATALVAALAPASVLWGMSALVIWLLAVAMLAHFALVAFMLARTVRRSRVARAMAVSWAALLVFPLGSIGARIGLFGYSWTADYAFVAALPIHVLFLLWACANRRAVPGATPAVVTSGSISTDAVETAPATAADRDCGGRRDLEGRLRELMEREQLYAQLGLTEADLAEACGVSRHELSLYLNSALDSGFYAFLDSYRIPHACNLLVEADNLSVLETAYRVGYNSKTTFNRRFKEHTGLSPREYRKRHANGHRKHLAKTGHSIE
jgi:AraC-like DNA-binding protein